MPYKDPEKRRESARRASRRWAAANREKRREYMRRWKSVNREKILEDNRRWKAANPEKACVAVRRWAAANPEKRREHHRRRRARKLNTTVEHFREPDCTGVCYLCGEKDLTRAQMHLDHVVPLSRGGSHTPDNVAWACAPCNLSKGAKPLEEWDRARAV